VTAGQTVAAVARFWSAGRGANAPNASSLSPFTPIPPKDGGGALRVLPETERSAPVGEPAPISSRSRTA
jgi:hypothetical protein